MSAYSSSKRDRSAATWLRPGPPRPSRQSEEEEGDREPLLLLEAGDISCHTNNIIHQRACRVKDSTDARDDGYLNVAQAFLQVGKHFGELGPVLRRGGGEVENAIYASLQ